MSEPRTEAGKALAEDYSGWVRGLTYGRTGEPIIAAIEAEARAELLAELREKVEALPQATGMTQGGSHLVRRDVVLALLEPQPRDPGTSP